MTEIIKMYNMCLRKKKLAESHADAVVERSGFVLRKYLCPYCGNWHVTKQKERSVKNV